MNSSIQEECCSRFNPEPWDGKVIQWQDKRFVRDRVRSIFHIPLNFGSVMKRNLELIVQAGARSEASGVLTDENSLWGADVYIEVTKDIPGAEMATLSGNFLCKVYEGPYSNMRKWIEDMKSFIQSQGRQIHKMYFYYTTCPKCAKKYGKNYVVLLAKV